jgi:hypothetical protein
MGAKLGILEALQIQSQNFKINLQYTVLTTQWYSDFS